MTVLVDLVSRLYPFAYGVTGFGNDAAIPAYQDELDFQIHEFPSSAELNGWRIPESWHVEHAFIRSHGELIYDGTTSPLGVMALSTSFQGTVSADVLKQHLYYSDLDPNAVPYHCQQIYRENPRTWGLCVPKSLFDSLDASTYEIDLVTKSQPGTMKVLEALLPGRSSDCVLLNAHNCHPFQANDDMSGVAVGIEVMRRLANVPDRKYSYRLVVAPELIGTVFWLDAIAGVAETLKHSIMLKSVGNDAELRLQESFTGSAEIDRIAHHVFKQHYDTYDSGAFRTVYGNDETVFEAPGYEIPSISLTRWPFASYHTDGDIPAALSEARLLDTVETVVAICLNLERNIKARRKFKGLVCLSNPRYGLYQPYYDPSLRDGPALEDDKRWNLLMNCLPRYLDGATSLLDAAEKHDLPLSAIYDYVMQWVDRGLAEVVDETSQLNCGNQSAQ